MTMSYRILGGTGIQVSAYCLGTMMFGGDGNPDHDDCARIIRAALDQGINFIDTADWYGEPSGETEEIVGTALKGRRDDVVLATKVHFPMGEGPNHGGNSRRWIAYEVEQSLQRLQTGWMACTRSTAPTPRPTSRKPCQRSPAWCRPGRSARSAARPSRPNRSLRPAGWLSGVGCCGSGPSSRRIRCWPGGSSPRCCRSASSWGWGC